MSRVVLPRNPSETKRQRESLKSILATVGILVLSPLIALFLTAFVFQSYEVDGPSMQHTLEHQDRLIVWKFPRTWAKLTGNGYLPKRGDIIIFNSTSSLTAGAENRQLVKRVIGLPGERVLVENGKITVFNKDNPNGFDPDNSGLYHISVTITPGNFDGVVPEGEIFVSGDNRPQSLDSRSFGPISVDDIVGKLSYRILPLSKAQHF